MGFAQGDLCRRMGIDRRAAQEFNLLRKGDPFRVEGGYCGGFRPVLDGTGLYYSIHGSSRAKANYAFVRPMQAQPSSLSSRIVKLFEHGADAGRAPEPLLAQPRQGGRASLSEALGIGDFLVALM
jgi:hypothetical protein